jgi:hypothetical protein
LKYPSLPKTPKMESTSDKEATCFRHQNYIRSRLGRSKSSHNCHLGTFYKFLKKPLLGFGRSECDKQNNTNKTNKQTNKHSLIETLITWHKYWIDHTLVVVQYMKKERFTWKETSPRFIIPFWHKKKNKKSPKKKLKIYPIKKKTK